MSGFFKNCLKYLLMNRDLQFCTIRGLLEAGQLAAILSVSNWLPVIANRLTEIFHLVLLPKGRLRISAILLTIRLKLEIVPTREIATKDFSFSRRWPWAYFLNRPNAAASTAPTLIRNCLQSIP